MIFWKVITVMAFLVLLSIETQLRKIAEYFEKRTELADEAIKIGKELSKEFGKGNDELNREFKKEKD